MKRSFITVLAFAVLAGGAEAGSAENDALSTKRRALQRPKRESLPTIGRPSNRDDAADHEEWKQIDELRAAGRHGKGRGDRDDDREGSED